ncbi:MAG TPA: NAD kinase, partial [Porphyromonadaceae bacterium]|nr:NAD kinase [Porphyromonadaceae bacterium]
MKIAIFGNTYQRDKLKKIQNLFEFLLSQKVDMYVEERFLSFVDKESVFLKKVNRIFGKGFPQCDMAISVGGDGSFLQTANK